MLMLLQHSALIRLFIINIEIRWFNSSNFFFAILDSVQFHFPEPKIAKTKLEELNHLSLVGCRLRSRTELGRTEAT